MISRVAGSERPAQVAVNTSISHIFEIIDGELMRARLYVVIA